jgi:hypothetical protein
MPAPTETRRLAPLLHDLLARFDNTRATSLSQLLEVRLQQIERQLHRIQGSQLHSSATSRDEDESGTGVDQSDTLEQMLRVRARARKYQSALLRGLAASNGGWSTDVALALSNLLAVADDVDHYASVASLAEQGHDGYTSTRRARYVIAVVSVCIAGALIICLDGWQRDARLKERQSLLPGLRAALTLVEQPSVGGSHVESTSASDSLLQIMTGTEALKQLLVRMVWLDSIQRQEREDSLLFDSERLARAGMAYARAKETLALIHRRAPAMSARDSAIRVSEVGRWYRLALEAVCETKWLIGAAIKDGVADGASNDSARIAPPTLAQRVLLELGRLDFFVRFAYAASYSVIGLGLFTLLLPLAKRASQTPELSGVEKLIEETATRQAMLGPLLPIVVPVAFAAVVSTTYAADVSTPGTNADPPPGGVTGSDSRAVDTERQLQDLSEQLSAGMTVVDKAAEASREAKSSAENAETHVRSLIRE